MRASQGAYELRFDAAWSTYDLPPPMPYLGVRFSAGFRIYAVIIR